MARVAFTELLPEILPAVPACPEMVAVHAARQAAIEFCEESGCWLVLNDSELIAPDDLPLTLDVPSGARLVRVAQVQLDQFALPAFTLAQLDATGIAWRDQVSDATEGYYMASPTELALYPRPSSNKTLSAGLVLTPTRAAQDIEDFLFERHYDGLAAGALARLYAIPGQPWSNPGLSVAARERFQVAVARAKRDALNGQSRAVISIRPRAFGY